MGTQAIKNWLQKLFAWWPWKRFPETDYTHDRTTLNKSTTPEPMARTTVDGPIPHPSITSIVVEHVEEEATTDTIGVTAEESPEENLSPASPTSEETSNTISQQETAEARIQPTGEAPSEQQRLDFLRYLVKSGLVNEGFTQGNVPEQYTKE